LKISGLEDVDLRRGFIICGLQFHCLVCYEFEAELQVLQLHENRPIMGEGYKCILHIHIAMEDATIAKVFRRYETEKKDMVASKFLKSGNKGIVIIRCELPLCLEKYDVLPNLGRFTIRDESLTIGTGKVLKYKPIKSTLV